MIMSFIYKFFPFFDNAFLSLDSAYGHSLDLCGTITTFIPSINSFFFKKTSSAKIESFIIAMSSLVILSMFGGYNIPPTPVANKYFDGFFSFT